MTMPWFKLNILRCWSVLSDAIQYSVELTLHKQYNLLSTYPAWAVGIFHELTLHERYNLPCNLPCMSGTIFHAPKPPVPIELSDKHLDGEGRDSDEKHCDASTATQKRSCNRCITTIVRRKQLDIFVHSEWFCVFKILQIMFTCSLERFSISAWHDQIFPKI